MTNAISQSLALVGDQTEDDILRRHNTILLVEFPQAEMMIEKVTSNFKSQLLQTQLTIVTNELNEKTSSALSCTKYSIY